MRKLFFYILFAATALVGCEGSLPENETVLLSPVSDTLLYSSTESGPFQIFTKRNDSLIKVINDASFDYWWVQVSPNRQKFICYKSGIDNFFKENDYSNAELWMFNIDGTGGKLLIAKGANAWRAQGYAKWHPDGKHIIMAAELKDPADENNYRWHLFVADTAGTAPVQLSTRVGLFSCPAVDATGTKIAYSAFPDDITSGSVFKQEIFVADLDTNVWALFNEERITDDNWWDENPSFSPNGNFLAFATATTPTNLFENINLRRHSFPDQSTVVLRADGASYLVPAWSKDGSYLYVQYRANGQRPFSLARINADGSAFTEIMSNEAADLINPIVY
jgi:Tol biopolymer transport system component